jgi:site-specific DNA-cytosine methylase
MRNMTSLHSGGTTLTFRPTQPYTFMDRFCGAGGLSLGFETAGLKGIYAADVAPAAIETYSRNFHHQLATLHLSSSVFDLPNALQ